MIQCLQSLSWFECLIHLWELHSTMGNACVDSVVTPHWHSHYYMIWILFDNIKWVKSLRTSKLSQGYIGITPHTLNLHKEWCQTWKWKVSQCSCPSIQGTNSPRKVKPRLSSRWTDTPSTPLKKRKPFGFPKIRINKTPKRSKWSGSQLLPRTCKTSRTCLVSQLAGQCTRTPPIKSPCTTSWPDCWWASVRAKDEKIGNPIIWKKSWNFIKTMQKECKFFRQ